MSRADGVVALAMLLGFGLRVGAVDDYWTSADEGIYYAIAHGPLEAARALVAHHTHPPLYYLLLRGVASVADGFVALRWPALLAGTLCIPAIHIAARELIAREPDAGVAGATAALLVAVSPGCIVLSQVARPYMLTLLLTLVAVAAGARWARDGGRAALSVYAVAIGLAVLTHYGSWGALAASAFVLFLWTARARGRRAASLFAAAHLPTAAIAVVLYVLHLRPHVLGSDFRQQALGGWLSAYFPSDPAGAWRSGIGLIDYLGYPEATATAAAVVAAAAVATSWRYRWVAAWVGATLATSFALAAAGIQPVGGSRHSILLAPALFLVLGAGVATAAAGGVRRMGAAGIAIGTLLVFEEQIEPWLGIPDTRRAPYAELSIDRSEGIELAETLAAQPPLLGGWWMDRFTAETLAPLFGASLAPALAPAAPDPATLTWRSHRLHVAPTARATAAAPSLGGPDHVFTHLERLRATQLREGEALPRYTGFVSARGASLWHELRGLVGPEASVTIFERVFRSRHFDVFRVDLTALHSALTLPAREATGRNPRGSEAPS